MSTPASPAVPAPPVHWRLVTTIAFRFCFLYFILYVVCTQMLRAMLHTWNWGAPNYGTRPPVSTAVMWVIRHVFHDDRTLAMLGGSGDKMYDWVLALCLLVSAALLTTRLVGVRSPPRALHALASGVPRVSALRARFHADRLRRREGGAAADAVPAADAAPRALRQLLADGRALVLDRCVAAVQIFTGCVELLCGILLFIPRTQLLGASLALAATVEVFTLNMTYDVPVKLFSFHLVLMSLVLLAPDVRRVCRAVFYHRVKWLAATAQVVFGAYLVGVALYGSAQQWKSPFGGGAPRPPLYGIWVIDRMTINGVERAPLVTDYERWRRVVIQNATSVTFWRMDDTAAHVPGRVDLDAKTITMTRPRARRVVLAVKQPAEDRLILDGDLDGKKLHMETTYFDRSRFLLVNRGFNWIQELPFNR